MILISRRRMKITAMFYHDAGVAGRAPGAVPTEPPSCRGSWCVPSAKEGAILPYDTTEIAVDGDDDVSAASADYIPSSITEWPSTGPGASGAPSCSTHRMAEHWPWRVGSAVVLDAPNGRALALARRERRRARRQPGRRRRLRGGPAGEGRLVHLRAGARRLLRRWRDDGDRAVADDGRGAPDPPPLGTGSPLAGDPLSSCRAAAGRSPGGRWWSIGTAGAEPARPVVFS